MNDVASPTLVVQRQRHHRVHIATEVEFAPRPGQRAGLVVRGNEQNHYQLLIEGAAGDQRDVVAFATIAGTRRELARRRLAPGAVVLVIEGYADRYEFFVEHGSISGALGSAPTTPFAYEETRSFTGAFVGLYAHHDAGAAPVVADFGWFEYKGAGVRVIRTAVRAPLMNSVVERFIRSSRRECLDHGIILGERHLCSVLSEFALEYLSTSRPHQGLGQRIPVPAARQLCSEPNKIVAVPVLGGLHHDYRMAP